MSDSESDIQDVIDSPPPKKKRSMDYKQKYKKEWEKEWNWVRSSKKGPVYAWCIYCCCDILVARGKGEIKKHESTDKHLKSKSTHKSQPSVLSMFENQKKNIGDKAKEGVLRLAGFVAEHNLPIKIMEHIPNLVKSICPDSEIAQAIKCSRTKMTKVIKNITGDEAKLQLIDILRKNKFSLIADESTDRSCSKHMCLVARVMVNFNIKDYFLALLPVKEATGVALFTLIDDFFKKHNISYEKNLIGFAADGANNMMGSHNSLASRLKEKCPNLFLLKCVCHSFHLCASYACEKLPGEVEQLAREVYNFFSNSPKRLDQYKEFQEFANVLPHKLLHPSQTRWLSLESVVKRLISQYSALTLYFTDQAYQGVLQADIILEKLKNPETKLYLEFLAYILPLFNQLTILMQSERPQIHKIYEQVTAVLKTIIDCFIKPDILRDNLVYEIDCKNPRNFLPIDDMYFGAAINVSKIDKQVLRSVKVKCLDFYLESAKQILLRFPLKNSAIEKLKCFDPIFIKAKQKNSISDVASLFPNLINPEEYQDLDNEWRMLKNYPLNDTENDIEIFWKEIAHVNIGDSPKFPNLTKFVFEVLCLPHSSATVERVFSQINLIKTQFRNKLKSKTIEGLLYTKSIMESKTCYDFTVSKNMIKNLGNSRVLYLEDHEQDSSDSEPS